VYTT
jgi:hypothetical protein